MKHAILIGVIVWFLLIATVSCTRAGEVGDFNEFIGQQVYSVYLEKANYIHEVDMGLQVYNPEMDKALGIEIDLLCNARGRNAKQCWYQMLFEVGGEFTVYRGW